MLEPGEIPVSNDEKDTESDYKKRKLKKQKSSDTNEPGDLPIM